MLGTKTYLFAAWSCVFLAILNYVLISVNFESQLKTLYVYLLMATFPLGIIGMFLMNSLANFFSESNSLFLVVSILFFAIGCIQWVVLLGALIDFMQKKSKK